MKYIPYLIAFLLLPIYPFHFLGCWVVACCKHGWISIIEAAKWYVAGLYLSVTLANELRELTKEINHV